MLCDTPAVHNCCYKCFLEQVRVVTTTAMANITRLRCRDSRMTNSRQHSTQSGVPFHQYCMPFWLWGQWMAFDQHQPKLFFYLLSFFKWDSSKLCWWPYMDNYSFLYTYLAKLKHASYVFDVVIYTNLIIDEGNFRMISSPQDWWQ